MLCGLRRQNTFTPVSAYLNLKVEKRKNNTPPPDSAINNTFKEKQVLTRNTEGTFINFIATWNKHKPWTVKLFSISNWSGQERCRGSVYVCVHTCVGGRGANQKSQECSHLMTELFFMQKSSFSPTHRKRHKPRILDLSWLLFSKLFSP